MKTFLAGMGSIMNLISSLTETTGNSEKSFVIEVKASGNFEVLQRVQMKYKCLVVICEDAVH